MSRRFSIRLAVAALSLLGGLAASPASSGAQESCVFVAPTRSLRGVGPVTYVGNPHMTCADGVEIWADSAIAYDNLGMQLMLGSVRYRDATRELQADTARYFDGPGRLQATGNVHISDASDGSEIRNGNLVYLRQNELRDVETMTVTTGADGVRPVALVPPATDTSAATSPDPGPPYRVVADRLVVHGDSYFAATGTVEIERDSLLAFADSAEYAQDRGDLFLDGDARVVSGETALTGRTITMRGSESDSTEIRATRDAVLTGDGLRLTAPVVTVALLDGELQRLVATPLRAEEADSADTVAPHATLDDAELTGDSLDILAPGSVVERVVAVGRARSVSTARDSLNTAGLPEIARTDWLEGDTVTVTFVPAGTPAGAAQDSADVAAPTLDTAAVVVAPDPPAAPSDTAAAAPPAADTARARYQVDQVVAAGSARALYRLASSDAEAKAGVDPPALHYVVGSRITIRFVAGDVDAMQVVGQTQGVHLEPLSRARPADSLAADTASAGATPDTARSSQDPLGARRDTLSGGDAAAVEVAPPTPHPAPSAPAGGRDEPARPHRVTREEPWIRK